MKITGNKDALEQAVKTAVSAIAKRPARPVLSAVVIDADDRGTVTVAAYDFERSATTTLDMDVTRPGTALIHGSSLSTYLSAARKGTASISVEGKTATVTVGTSSARFQVMPAADYPNMPTPDITLGVVDGSEFSRMVNVARSASGHVDSVPILAGVTLRLFQDTLEAWGTDRYRVGHYAATFDRSSGEDEQMTVRADMLQGISSTVEAAGNVTLSTNADRSILGVNSGTRRHTVTVMEGEFPKAAYTLFDMSLQHYVDVSLEDLQGAIRVVSAADEPGLIEMVMDGAHLRLTSNSATGSGITDQVAAESNLEGAVALLNHAYTAKAIAYATHPTIRISTANPAKPITFTQITADGEIAPEYRYMVMPAKKLGA